MRKIANTSKIFLLGVIIILIGAGAFWYFSQRQSIQGKVIDSATKEPLRGIKVKAGDNQKKTDSKGKFSFTLVSDVDKLQVISPEDYEKDKIAVPVSEESLGTIKLTPTLLETRNRVHRAIENNNFDKFWLYFHPDDKKTWKKEEYKKEFESNIGTTDSSKELSVGEVGNWPHHLRGKEYQGVKRIYPKESEEGFPRYFSSTYWQKKDGYYHFFSNRLSPSQKKNIKKKIRESSQNALLSIREVKKAPQDSIGEKVVWEGDVVQINERDGQTVALVEEQETYDMFVVVFDGTTDLLSGDTAEAKGIVETVSSYESQAKWTITAPLIRAVDLSKKKTTSKTFDDISYDSSSYGSDSFSCSDECSFQSQKTCQGDEVQTCKNYDLDNCLEWRTSKTCKYGCSGGRCNSPPLGHSMEKPASAGKPLTIRTGGAYSLDNDAYKTRVTLLEVVRGTEAWNRLKEASGEFIEPQSPDAGFEYLLAKVKFDFLESKTESSKFTLGSTLFSAVSSEGKEYEDSWVTTPEPRLDADLYEGGSQTGWLLFEVKKDDSKPLMAFGRDSDGTGGLWFKLY